MIPSLKSDPRLCGTCPLRQSADNLRAVSESWQSYLFVRSVEKNCVLHTESNSPHLVTVRQGSLKVESIPPGGDTQVLGFLLPGESVLLSPLRRHSLAITTMEASTVCEIDVERVRGLVPDVTSFFEGLTGLAMLQGELLGRPDWIADPAPRRLKSFLRDLERRAGPGKEIALPMSREDLANHLAMRPETLSRALAALVRTREITLTSIHSVILNKH